MQPSSLRSTESLPGLSLVLAASRLARAAGLGLLLALVTLSAQPGCSQHRAPGPSAEEGLPPSSQRDDPELPKKKSAFPGEEALGTVLLVTLLLAAAAGMAYLSFVVIPDAIK